jgi:hypothetical protein
VPVPVSRWQQRRIAVEGFASVCSLSAPSYLKSLLFEHLIVRSVFF